MTDTDNHTLVLTGATGFLGSHLLSNLVHRGYKVIVLKRSTSDTHRIEKVLPDITCFNLDSADTEDIFSRNSVDGIIHLATDYGKKDFSIQKMVRTNIELPTTLLTTGMKHGVKYFINANTFLPSQYSLYASMKNGFLEQLKFFSSNYPLKVINMKIAYMYGESDNDTSKFIPLVCDSILNNKEIDATGGRQKRDFIYVGNVVDAYAKVLSHIDQIDAKFTEFEIGSGTGLSFLDFVHEIELSWGKKARIHWGKIPYSRNEIFEMAANISRSRDVLGWNPAVDIKEGIERTLSYWKKNGDC